MKQTPAKKPRAKALKVTPPPAEQPQQQLTPIDIIRGVVQQFDKLQQEHAALMERFTIVAYALAVYTNTVEPIKVSEEDFRDELSLSKVTINPVIKDGLVTIETSLQPL